MDKEYGGYLPFELSCNYEEFFYKYGDNNFVRLDCGRSTIWYALKIINPQKVYVPYLNCINSIDPIIELNIDYEYYLLYDDLTPKGINPKKNEAVIWVNYYGNATDEQKEKVKILCRNSTLIIDNCQAFFSNPEYEAYNCYSTRKFFGVCDGAYLLKKNIKKLDLPQSVSSENIGFLLECIEKGTNACYHKNLVNENRLGKVPMVMSRLTQKILQTIDYYDIKKKRTNNLIVINERLKKYNEFSVNEKFETNMYYPLLISRDGLREMLIEKKIYVPTWWRHVPEYFQNINLETILSKYMLLIPIDQRYSEDDMNDIADIVEECIMSI